MKKLTKKDKKLLEKFSKIVKVRSSSEELYKLIKENVIEYYNDYYKKDVVAVVKDEKGRIVGYFIGKELMKYMPAEAQLVGFMMLDAVVDNKIND